MKRIGAGLQFIVYSKGSKVIKVPSSKKHIFLKLVKWYPYLLFHPKKLLKKVDESVKVRDESVEGIKNRKINLELLANPIFEKDYIIQDKVMMLKRVLWKNDKKAKKAIDEYIKLIFECWKNGFADDIFNLSLNNGVNKKGKVVLVDFGEVVFDKKRVEQRIKNKRWIKTYSYNIQMNLFLRKYYVEQMNKHITLENLEKFWGKEAKL